MFVTTSFSFQSPHRAYGHSDPDTGFVMSMDWQCFNLLIELTVIPTYIRHDERLCMFCMFQSPHRAYGHSDDLKIDDRTRLISFQSPHRAYGHSDVLYKTVSAILLSSFNLLIELTVIPTWTHVRWLVAAIESFNLLIELTVIPTSLILPACLSNFNCFNLLIELTVIPT